MGSIYIYSYISAKNIYCLLIELKSIWTSKGLDEEQTSCCCFATLHRPYLLSKQLAYSPSRWPFNSSMVLWRKSIVYRLPPFCGEGCLYSCKLWSKGIYQYISATWQHYTTQHDISWYDMILIWENQQNHLENQHVTLKLWFFRQTP